MALTEGMKEMLLEAKHRGRLKDQLLQMTDEEYLRDLERRIELRKRLTGAAIARKPEPR